MNNYCNICSLNYMVEEYRERLNDIIIEKNYNLLDEEVINLSQLLDDLIDKEILFEKNLNM